MRTVNHYVVTLIKAEGGLLIITKNLIRQANCPIEIFKHHNVGANPHAVNVLNNVSIGSEALIVGNFLIDSILSVNIRIGIPCDKERSPENPHGQNSYQNQIYDTADEAPPCLGRGGFSKDIYIGAKKSHLISLQEIRCRWALQEPLPQQLLHRWLRSSWRR